MRYGVSIPNNQGVASIADLAMLAENAERLGYDSVWVSDHLFHAAYVAKRLNDRPYHEPMTVLTVLAARTQRVMLGTSVLVLPWHHPYRLAKTVASLDQFSQGRVWLGVGVGLTEDEYAALNVPFNDRGKHADEILAMMKTLWEDDFPEHHGQRYDFKGLRFEPKPFAKPHPPILVGGNSSAAIRRTVQFGQGWHPLSQSPDMLKESVAGLGAALSAAGRDPKVPVIVRTVVEFMAEPSDRPIGERRTAKGTVEELRALVDAFEAAGVTEFIVDPTSPDVGYNREVVDRFWDEVVNR